LAKLLCPSTSTRVSSPVSRSFADTLKMPSLSISNATSTSTSPAGALRIPSSAKSCRRSFSLARGLSPWSTTMRNVS
jgi:hypothetical protein